ncbi:protein starmaker-like [Impatiens glandulifera]|uniref:protein starmaker-like n=1 Tax=Impatiens glandulifera TaxID=253017 RepID=UPI001FB17113|nr:protein starmaker-like [Impatiens glandulifera]
MSSTKYLLLSCLLFASLFVYAYSRALIDTDSFVASNDDKELVSLDEDSSNDDKELDSLYEDSLENDDLDSIDEESNDHKKSGHKHKRHPCRRHSRKTGRHHHGRGPVQPPKPSSNINDFNIDNEVDQYEGLDSFDEESNEESLEMDDDLASIDEESHDHKKKHGHKHKRHPCKRHTHSRKGKGKRSHAPVEPPTQPPTQPPTGSSNIADIDTWMDLDESVASVDEESFDQMNYDDLDPIDEESNDDHKESGHKHKRHPCKRHSRKSGRHHHGSGPVQPPKPSYEINDIDNEMEQYEGVDSIDDQESLEMNDEESEGHKKSEHKGKHKPCRRHSHAHPPKRGRPDEPVLDPPAS